MNNEIGKQYGYLTVLDDTGKTYHSIKIYKCQCICGNTIEVNINKLHTGHVKSCGCRRFRCKDLTGQKFGQFLSLFVIDGTLTVTNAGLSKTIK